MWPSSRNVFNFNRWPGDIGNEVIKNKNIDLITFTGSVGVGKLIAENAGYKRTVLELGGNDLNSFE